jgi:hypothetical protein
MTTHPYFTAKAREAFTKAGGNPDASDRLAEWAEALRNGPDFDSRVGVIVAEDGALLAETRHIPATGWSPGATYVEHLLVDESALDTSRTNALELRLLSRLELGLACGTLRRLTGQGVIHVTASQICTGAGALAPAAPMTRRD